MHFKPIIQKLCLSSAVGIAALLTACGGGGEDGGQGTLQVSLTDAPSCGYDKVNVTVSKVRVHQSADAGANEAGWHEIVLAQPKKINLLDLTNGVLENLGEVTLPAGRYTQMRLVLDSASSTGNSVVLTGGTEEVALATPSGMQSGIKLNHPFDVAAGAQVRLTLDFDACKSIVTKGNGGYALKPVIGVIPMATTGRIIGFVTPDGDAAKPNAVVSAQQDGVVVKSTVADDNGRFDLYPLPASSTGYVVVITADGQTTTAITGVPVTAGAATQLSAETAPIPRTISAMRTITGTVNPASAQAMVRATQTYSGGPKVEVAFKSADLTTGAYTLSVPAEAPVRGTYGTLPIALQADTAVAGKYTLEASAAGYTAQPINVDLSAPDAPQNFTLVSAP